MKKLPASHHKSFTRRYFPLGNCASSIIPNHVDSVAIFVLTDQRLTTTRKFTLQSDKTLNKRGETDQRLKIRNKIIYSTIRLPSRTSLYPLITYPVQLHAFQKP
jgi:hypothetical protein